MHKTKIWHALRDALELAGVEFERDDLLYGTYNGRRVRVLEESMTLEVGDDNFDRWANSVEYATGLTTRNFSRRIPEALSIFCEDT